MNPINVFVATLCAGLSLGCMFTTAAQGNGVFTCLFAMMLLQSVRDLCNEYSE